MPYPDSLNCHQLAIKNKSILPNNCEFKCGKATPSPGFRGDESRLDTVEVWRSSSHVPAMQLVEQVAFA